jgi:hypothetical protein
MPAQYNNKFGNRSPEVDKEKFLIGKNSTKAATDKGSNTILSDSQPSSNPLDSHAIHLSNAPTTNQLSTNIDLRVSEMQVNEAKQTSNLESQEYCTSGLQYSIEQQADDFATKTDTLALFALKHFGEDEDSTRAPQLKREGNKDDLSCYLWHKMFIVFLLICITMYFRSLQVSTFKLCAFRFKVTIIGLSAEPVFFLFRKESKLFQ